MLPVAPTSHSSHNLQAGGGSGPELSEHSLFFAIWRQSLGRRGSEERTTLRGTRAAAEVGKQGGEGEKYMVAHWKAPARGEILEFYATFTTPVRAQFKNLAGVV